MQDPRVVEQLQLAAKYWDGRGVSDHLCSPASTGVRLRILAPQCCCT
ncbi:MAG TPA: hypothetical protein VKX16_19860 [Chloroflexota bacterium]|nr:hypothetical protein [Chloroflexota bacterium]